MSRLDGNHQRSGLVYAGLCAASGAFVPAVARLTTDRADPILVAAITTVFAGLAGALVLLARGQFGQLVERRTVGWLIVIAALGTVTTNLLFFIGTSRTSAIDAVLCLQVEPIYSLLLAWLVLGHRLSVRRVASAAILLAGILIAIGEARAETDFFGLAILMATPLAWQVSHLVVLGRLTTVEPEVLTGARYVWGGILLAPVAAVLLLVTGGESGLPDVETLLSNWPVLAVQGVVLNYAGTMLWYQAITRLDLARATSIVVPSIPLMSLAASFLIVGEVPTGRQIAGMLITALGVLSFVLSPHAIERRERPPSATAPLGAPTDEASDSDAA